MKKKKLLFIGSHLSHIRGTKGISEKIAERLYEKYDLELVSKHENQFLRMSDIVLSSLLKSYEVMHIDVFSNRGFIYAEWASRIGRLKNKKIIMTLRGGMLAEKYEKEQERLKKVFERADVLQSPSLFLIDFFKKQNIEVSYMPNFIDLSLFKYKWVQPVKARLLWVRAFSPEYRPELAVMTLKKVLESHPEATLTMVGPDKGILSEIKELVTKYHLESQVTFTGKIPNEELPSLYHSHSVYLNTTAYESFGVAVLEAAACGIPVVSTRVGEIPFLWKEDNEIMMCDANDKDMSNKVNILIESKEKADKLSNSARKKAGTFDWESSIKEQWIELLNVVS